MLPVAVGLKGNINTFSQPHKASSEQLTLNTAEFQSADSLASLNSGAFCSELVFFSFFNSAFVFPLKVKLHLSSTGVPL